MLDIKPPQYIFCPFCGKKLTIISSEGMKYKHCRSDNWTYYPNVFQSSNAVIVKNGQILLSQRGRPPYIGKWMLPAGFVNFGEHPEETVIREVKEETSLIANNPVFLAVLQTQDDPRAMGNLAFYYKVNVKGTLKNNDTRENLAVMWFDINNIPEIAWRDHKKIIELVRTDKI